jgi:hypothetical protein
MTINMKKQTAVEWLEQAMIKKMNSQIGPSFLELFVKAKAMEKQQISEAYRTGVEEDVYSNPLRTGEMYYNQTFK